eukprot:COSAG02_NODE_31820_length_526_cov_12.039813_1_plen_30_part_10
MMHTWRHLGEAQHTENPRAVATVVHKALPL